VKLTSQAALVKFFNFKDCFSAARVEGHEQLDAVGRKPNVRAPAIQCFDS
jgi:hypothetical protein